MNSTYMICMGILAVFSNCSQTKKTNQEQDKLALRKAMENYALDKLANGKAAEVLSGKISISDSVYRYDAEIKEAVYGRINSDTLSDVVIPMKVYYRQLPIRVEHLVLLKEISGYRYGGTLNKIYKIKEIESSTITAEYTDLPFDSPIYGCRECIKVYKYRLIGDSLVKVDSLESK